MKKSSVIFGGLAALAAVSAWAEEAAPTTTSTAAAPAVKTGFTDNMTLLYTGIYDGASLGAPFDNKKTDTATGIPDPGSPTEIRHYVDTHWKISDNVKVGPVIYFKTAPWAQDETKRTTLMDPYLRFRIGNVIKEGNFNLGLDARFGIPASKASQEAMRVTYLYFRQISSYDIPNTRFNLSLETIQRYQAYRSGRAAAKNGAKAEDFLVVADPIVNYQVSPSVVASLIYDMGGKHMIADPWDDFSNAGTTLTTSIAWDVTPTLNLNPYVDIPTGQRIAPDTSLYGLALVWKIL